MSEDNYYRLPNFWGGTFSIVGMTYLSLSHLNPSVLPNHWLGPLGTLTSYLVKHQPHILALIFYLAWLAHFGEATYAFILARRKKISVSASLLWCVSTFLCGIFSLRYLLRYRGKKSKSAAN